jgi:hypothetical protein
MPKPELEFDLRHHAHRDSEFGVHNKLGPDEVRFRHSDHCKVEAVEFHSPAYHIGIGSKAGLPASISENLSGFAPRFGIFAWTKEPGL